MQICKKRLERPKPLHASKQAAEAVGTSSRGIARAKKLREQAAPEIVSACIDGTLRAGDAVGILDLSHDEQRQCLEAVQQGQARTVTRRRKSSSATSQARGRTSAPSHQPGEQRPVLRSTPGVYSRLLRVACLGEIDLDPATSHDCP